MTDLLASIDDVLQGDTPAAPAPVVAPAPAPVVAPVPVPTPADPVEPVRRSTVTDVEYNPVGPRIAERLKPSVPVRPPVPVDVPVEPEPEDQEPEPESEPESESGDAAGASAPWWSKPASRGPGPVAGPGPVVVAAPAAGAPGFVPAAPAEAAPVAEGRWRWLFYNGGAAGAGHLAIWSVTGDPMAGADLMGRAMESVVPLGVMAVTAGAVYAGWKAAGYLRGLPGWAGLVVRPVAAGTAGLWGQGTRPLLTDGMAALHPWPQFFAPLLIAGAAGAACWWLAERRCAAWIRPLRFVARIPLATVVLSSLLYAPGALL